MQNYRNIDSKSKARGHNRFPWTVHLNRDASADTDHIATTEFDGESVFGTDVIKNHLFLIEALFSAENVVSDFKERVARMTEKSVENCEMGIL